MYFPKGDTHFLQSWYILHGNEAFSKGSLIFVALNTDRKGYRLVFDDGQVDDFVEPIAKHTVQLDLLYWNSKASYWSWWWLVQKYIFMHSFLKIFLAVEIYFWKMCSFHKKYFISEHDKLSKEMVSNRIINCRKSILVTVPLESFMPTTAKVTCHASPLLPGKWLYNGPIYPFSCTELWKEAGPARFSAHWWIFKHLIANRQLLKSLSFFNHNK